MVDTLNFCMRWVHFVFNGRPSQGMLNDARDWILKLTKLDEWEAKQFCLRRSILREKFDSRSVSALQLQVCCRHNEADTPCPRPHP